jgi:Zn-finger protein
MSMPTEPVCANENCDHYRYHHEDSGCRCYDCVCPRFFIETHRCDTPATAWPGDEWSCTVCLQQWFATLDEDFGDESITWLHDPRTKT